MRYEIKYAIPIIDRHMIEQIILSHPASFTTAFPDRIVNNIYYDDLDLTAFYQNVDGNPNRKKVRQRWYNNDDPSKGQIEIKVKKGMLGYKEYLSIENAASVEQVITSQLHVTLQPTLCNRYLRSYFLSSDGKFRLTVDRDISYFHPESEEISALESQHIIEIKFEQDDYPLFDAIHRNIPLRQTKYSKYVNGLIKITS